MSASVFGVTARGYALMKTSPRGSPDSRTAAPTAASLRYACAESTWLHVDRRQTSAGSVTVYSWVRAPVSGSKGLENRVLCGEVLVDPEPEEGNEMSCRCQTSSVSFVISI